MVLPEKNKWYSRPPSQSLAFLPLRPPLSGFTPSLSPTFGPLSLGENNESIIDYFLSWVAWIIRFSNLSKQGTQSDVILYDHIFTVITFWTHRCIGCFLDWLIINRFWNSVVTRGISLVMIGCRDIIKKERLCFFDAFSMNCIPSRRKLGPIWLKSQSGSTQNLDRLYI